MEIVRSKIMSQFPEILFGMSTNTGGVSAGTYGLNLSFNVKDDPAAVQTNRKLFFNSLQIAEENIAFTQQQHTSNISLVDHSGVNTNCDALITNKKNLFLAISIADCTPVMIYDPKNNVVAGIHAGWRGTAAKIVEKSIRQMNSEYGCVAKDLVVFIGPSAGNCCYEVGEEVAVQFPLQCISKKNENKYLLNVKLANVMQLLDNGVLNSNIEVNTDCTIQSPLYHSHRRDGSGSGRMVAVIGIKS